MKMKLYRAVAESLLSEGIDTVYALMTSDNMSLLTHLADRGVRVIRARTEHGAVCMADGYARVTGRVGVAAVGAGPSAGLTATALVTAKRRRSPLVLLAGDVPQHERHHLKQFDQAGFFLATAEHCITTLSGATMLPDLFEAFRRARAGDGPSVVSIPVDVLEADVDTEMLASMTRFMTPAVLAHARQPSPDDVSGAVELLMSSQRPMILAGRGALSDRCRDLMTSIGDRLGAVFGASLQAQHLFDGRYDLGVVGTLATDAANDIAARSDVVLAVGVALNVYTTAWGAAFPDARIIQIDARDEAIGATTPVDVAIVADTTLALEAIDAALATRIAEPRQGLRGGVDHPAVFVDPLPRERRSGDLDPRDVLDAIDGVLSDEATVVIDAGHFAFFVIDYLHVAPQRRIWTADFASIGISLPLAIGAAAADPGRPTIVFVGDGGFVMTLVDLDAAVRHEIPLIVVVINDAAYGAEVRYLENRGEAVEMAQFTSPDLAAIAAGFGCDTITVRTLEELDAACQRMVATSRPLVIDVRVNPTIANRHFRTRKNSAAGAS
jgi:acetolactate synthase-1/2/3 large subunit